MHMIHFMCNFHQKLLVSNYKINNHGQNEIRHNHLKFIPVKEISYMVKTKHSRPKQIINFASKTNYCSEQKPKQWAACFGQLGHPSMRCITAQCVHNVDFRISFCFPVTVFYERASELQSCRDFLCSVANDSPRMTAQNFDLTSTSYGQRFTAFVWYYHWFQINRLHCSINICFRLLTAGWYVVTKGEILL